MAAGLDGFVLVDEPRSFFPMGLIPSGGTLTVKIAAPNLAPGVAHRQYLLQSVHVSPSGALTLGDASAAVVLDLAY